MSEGLLSWKRCTRDWKRTVGTNAIASVSHSKARTSATAATFRGSSRSVSSRMRCAGSGATFSLGSAASASAASASTLDSPPASPSSSP